MATLAAPPIGGGSDFGGGVTPSGPDPGADLGAALGDAFDSALGAEGGLESAPPGEAGHDASQPSETPVETPGGEAPQDAQAPQAPAEGEYPLSPDGSAYMVPKADLPGLQAERAFAREVQQYFTTPAEALQAYQQSSDLRVMFNDWTQGSEPALQGVLSHLAGLNHQDPGMRARYQQSFVNAATRIVPQMLQQMAPQAYDGMAQTFVGRAIEKAYERAAETQNPEDFKAAQYFDWGHTGKYKTELPKVDPEARARTQFEQERQQFEQRQSQAMERDVRAFNLAALEGNAWTQNPDGSLGAPGGGKYGALAGQIDKLLAPVAKRYPGPTLDAAKQAILNETRRALERQSEWWLEHEQAFRGIVDDWRSTWRQGKPGAGLQSRIQSYQRDFLTRASRVLPQIVQKHLGAATQTQTRNANGQFTPAKGQNPPAAPAGQNGSQGGITRSNWDEEWAKAWRA